MIAATIERRSQFIMRESLFVGLVILLVLLPWLPGIGALAWISIGGLIAFAALNPRWILLSVPAAIGLSFKPVEFSSLQFNILEVLILFAGIGYLPRAMGVAWRHRSQILERPRAMLRRWFCDEFGLAIAGVVLLAGVVSLFLVADPNHLRESLRVFRWTILFPITFFLLLVPEIRTREVRVFAVGSFLAGAVVASVIALTDGLTGGGVQADAVTRVSGLASHPNALALYLERAAVFGMLLAALRGTNASRWWAAAGLLAALVTVLTFSRGAVLAVAVATLVMLAIMRRRDLALYGLLASAVVVTGMIAAAPERTLSLLGGGSGSLRLELWKSSVEMIRDYPLSGVGLDQFLYQYLPRYVTPEAWSERFTSHPHNLLLDVWLSLGILGLLSLLAVGIFWVRRVRFALEYQRVIPLAAAGALLTVVVHGMVDQTYFRPELAVSTWFLVALLSIVDQPGPQHPAGSSGESEGKT